MCPIRYTWNRIWSLSFIAAKNINLVLRKCHANYAGKNEHGGRRVIRHLSNGKKEILADNFKGRKLDYDLVNSSNGEIIAKIGDKITQRNLNLFKEQGLKSILVNNEQMLGKFIADDVINESTGEVYAEAGDENDFTLSEALRTPAFYIVAAGLFTLSMLVTTLHFFQVSIFSDQGLDTEVATVAFAVSAVTMIAMMPTLGRMLDRFPTERMFAGGLLILATTLVIAAQVSGITSALLYALAFGVANAVSMTYYTFMWPRYFGRSYLGSIQGTGQMIGVVGASVGPLPLGFAKDYLGNYDAMLLGLAVIPLTWAVVAALFLRQPVKLKPL